MYHSSNSAIRFKKLCHSLGSAIPEIYICATDWIKKIRVWAVPYLRLSSFSLQRLRYYPMVMCVGFVADKVAFWLFCV